MGVQISRGVHSQVSEKNVVRGVAAAPGGGIPQSGQAKRMQYRKRSYHGGSCAHVDIDPAEICSVAGSRVIKGKSAIHLARVYGGKKRNFVGQHFWARGYFVSTVGRNEEVIREYIKNQEAQDKHIDQLNLWK